MNRNKVEDALFSIGITANLKGFKYIVDALEVIEEEGCDVSMTKVLYPKVAKMNRTTTSRVERAIRHAFEISNSDRGDYEVFEKYIGHINTTNGAALTSLYKHIKREEEEEKVGIANQPSKISPELDSTIRKIVKKELRRIVSG